MKRGCSLALAFIALTIISISLVSASDGYFGNFSQISLSDLAKSEWVNAALMFFLIFSVCIFALRDVFKRSYGAAVIASIVMGAIGGLGFTYFYGPIITKIAPWLLAVFIAVIFFGLWRFLKGMKAIKLIALALSLLWLLYAGPNGCPPKGNFPGTACQILNFVAIAILLVVVIGWFLDLARRKSQGMAEREAAGGGRGTVERPILTISIQGGGIIKPKQGQYRKRLNERARVTVVDAISGWVFSHWDLDGANIGHYPQANVIMNTDHHLTAVFVQAGAATPRGIAPKRRNVSDLKQKYIYNYNYAMAIATAAINANRQNDPRIRQRLTRIIQLLTTIIKTANRLGYRPSIFLSRAVGGINARFPKDLINYLRQNGFMGGVPRRP